MLPILIFVFIFFEWFIYLKKFTFYCDCEFLENFTQKLIEIINTNLDEVIQTFSLYLFT